MIMATRSLLLASLLADADAARKAAPRKSALDIAADKAARGAEYIDPFIVMGTEKELQKRLDWMATDHVPVNLLTGELATEAKRMALDRRKNRTKTEQEEKVDVMAWYSKMKAEL